MSFTIRKLDGVGLRSVGARLGHNDRVTAVTQSSLDIVAAALNGETLAFREIDSTPKQDAKYQVGMQNKPSMRGPR